MTTPAWSHEERTMPTAAAESTFEATAAAHGFDAEVVALMVDAAESLHMALGDATEWLDADITPWASVAWREQGFADGHEAAEYRRWGYGPTAAYWARRDGSDVDTLRARRHLCALMAGRPARAQ